MGNIDPVALTALIISLVALVVTFAQLLQQYFATADGYRQCLPSVMGSDWGRKTRKRMRWRELRYETLYYVPSISMELSDSPDVDHRTTVSDVFKQEWKTFNLSGKFVLRPEKTAEKIQEEDKREIALGFGEKVCWLAFLDRLQVEQGDVDSIYRASLLQQTQWEKGNRATQMSSTPAVICMRILKRSWDFMPAEVVRPLCMSTISDIGVLAIRLGMNWKEFNPVGGVLMAEGGGQLITSRVVRSLGLCIEYSCSPGVLRSKDNDIRRAEGSEGDLLLNAYLPVGGLASLVFGIVPGNKNLKCFDRAMGTLDEITDFLDFLDNTGSVNLHLKQQLMFAIEEKPGWIPGFNDVIPLTAAKMSSEKSNLRNLPMPNTYSAGVLRTREGLQVFCHRLHAYVADLKAAASPQLLQVQRWVSRFENQYEHLWYANESTWAYVPPHHMLKPVPTYQASEKYQKEVHTALDEAETFLIGINRDPMGSIRSDRKDERSGFCYDTLLVEHLRMAIVAYGRIKVVQDKDGGRPRWMPPGRDWLSATMHGYWDELPDLTRKVAEYTGCDVEVAVEAWVTMIFRAFCWHHCHHLVATQMALPSQWHGSQLPVYIG